MALFREGRPRFPEDVNWSSSGFETRRHKQLPVPIEAGDILVIIVGYSSKSEIRYTDFTDAFLEGNALLPGDLIEHFISNWEQPYDQTVIVAEVMHRSDSISTLCYIEPITTNEDPTFTEWSLDFTSLVRRKATIVH